MQTDIPLGDGRRVRLGGQIGRGTVASVHRGVIEGGYGIRRAVAVKLYDVIASDEHEVVLSALSSAAQRSACVRHPNVVRVEEFGLAGPAQPFMVEELVEGRTLAALLEHVARRRVRLALDVGLFIGVEIAEGLAGARLATTPDGMRQSVAHGELAASDVLLSWHGEVKVSDFGFAAAARAATGVRSIRSLAPRVRALAPEVARGQAGDSRSDVFSLGVLLREMLVAPRFPAAVSDAEAIGWVRDGVVHQSMFEPQLPPALQAIISRAIERDPVRRYPHAGVFAYELRRVGLAMGVGDGRTFLGAALTRAFPDDAGADLARTGEVPIAPSSGVVDRGHKHEPSPDSGQLPIADAKRVSGESDDD
jgi:serine/threonine-protein kinase